MSSNKWWHNLEQGQALMEYWPTIPAAIMIIISTGMLGSFLRNSFGQTAEVLNRSSVGIDYEQCEITENEISGPQTAAVDSHLIEFVSSAYDGTQTTIVYRVTSSEKEALSHWVLGIPKDVADNIVDASEQYGWTDNDPKTGAQGIKFDTGYGEGGGNTGGEEIDTGGGKPDKEDKGKPGKRTPMSSHMSNISLFQIQTESGFADGEVREITLVLQGEYSLAATSVTTKSGNGTGYTGTIVGPTIIIDQGHTQTTVNNCDTE